MDTHISICAPEVLMLFSDNFDYQNVKRDFVSGEQTQGLDILAVEVLLGPQPKFLGWGLIHAPSALLSNVDISGLKRA